MIKVGLTGGIGSGKSTVANIFSMLGTPLYNADIEAKKAYENIEVFEKVKQIFGDKVVDNSGTKINRGELAKIVFNDTDALARLNKIIHPYLKVEFEAWLLKKGNFKYIIQEAAILFESGFYKSFDKIISVNADIELRIERVMMRDNSNRLDVIARISNQWTDYERELKSDYVIYNNDNQRLLPQVLEIHKQLLNL